jgi:hypothetical protein
VRIEKLKRQATLYRSDGWKVDVYFFLRQAAEEHSGREVLLDILNSKASFVPVQGFQADEFFLVNKEEIMCLELEERDLPEQTMLAPEIAVQVELTFGKILDGNFFLDMPPERSRLSDYVNFSPQFLYLCREEGDIIVNKAYLFTVKERS